MYRVFFFKACCQSSVLNIYRDWYARCQSIVFSTKEILKSLPHCSARTTPHSSSNRTNMLRLRDTVPRRHTSQVVR